MTTIFVNSPEFRNLVPGSGRIEIYVECLRHALPEPRVETATDKEFVFTTFGAGLVDAAKGTANPPPGFDFSYPGTSAPTGLASASLPVPLSPIGSLSFSLGDGPPLVSISDFRPLAYAALAALETAADVYHAFLRGNDRITGCDAPDVFSGFHGHDLMSGRGSADTLNGGRGNDTLNGDDGRDRLRGDSGNDSLFGGHQGDVLQGGSGNDLLSGGDGNDGLDGGEGDDRLIGGFGADSLRGGAGADLFVYQTLPAANVLESGPSPSRRDVITDFTPGEDRIDIGFILPDPFAFVGTGTLTGGGQVAVRHADGNTFVDISTDADAGVELSILLHGLLTLTAADFAL